MRSNYILVLSSWRGVWAEGVGTSASLCNSFSLAQQRTRSPKILRPSNQAFIQKPARH